MVDPLSLLRSKFAEGILYHLCNKEPEYEQQINTFRLISIYFPGRKDYQDGKKGLSAKGVLELKLIAELIK